MSTTNTKRKITSLIMEITVNPTKHIACDNEIESSGSAFSIYGELLQDRRYRSRVNNNIAWASSVFCALLVLDRV
ncbi:hypothetical protein MtrunA17_Chr8g0344571 [Medicago truncatula]|uniref:Transmembrane protein n=1 Tax=Medicago truncatula TaxID=3880 RepID=A0A396GE79_MEDTR|nr:hypothetical protein MtrunA17_Chr8g0344571 [Medicago truncatula]